MKCARELSKLDLDMAAKSLSRESNGFNKLIIQSPKNLSIRWGEHMRGGRVSRAYIVAASVSQTMGVIASTEMPTVPSKSISSRPHDLSGGLQDPSPTCSRLMPTESRRL